MKVGEGQDRSPEKDDGGREPEPSHDQRRKPSATAKPLTAARIRNIAEAYVAQRESSAAMLREVLERRLLRRLRSLDPDDAAEERAAALPLIEAEVERLVSAGLVEDGRYAGMKARAGLASGRGARRILRDLGRKGITSATAQEALLGAAGDLVRAEDAEPETILRAAEDEAADTFARKKRIGPYRSTPLPEDWSARSKLWRKEASAMVRAGFGADTIRRVLDREPEQDD